MQKDPALKGQPFYYGWVIVVLAAVAMAATLPSRTMGLGLITNRLLGDLSITELHLSQMNLIATMAAAFFCWPCGWLIDRFGLKIVTSATIAALGIVTIAMSRVESPTQLALTMVLARGFGQGALSVISITMVAKWFKRRLPITMGLYSILLTILMTIGFMSVTAQLGASASADRTDIAVMESANAEANSDASLPVIESKEWRPTWFQIGSVLLSISIFMLFFVRDRKPSESQTEFAQEQIIHEDGASLIDAVTSPTFWVFALSIAFFGLVYSGVSLFNQSVLESRGFSEKFFHDLLPIGMLVGLVFNLATGAAAQWLSQSKLLAVALLVLGATYAAFPMVTTLPQVYIYTIINAAAGGMLTVLFFSIWGAAFGGHKLGQIQGLAQGLSVVASALGPICITLVKSETNSYNGFFFAAAFVCFVFAVLAAVIRVPSPRDFVDRNQDADIIPSTR